MKEPKRATGCWLVAFLFFVVMALGVTLPVWRCGWCKGVGSGTVAGEHEGRIVNVGGSLWSVCTVCGGRGRTGFVDWCRTR